MSNLFSWGTTFLIILCTIILPLRLAISKCSFSIEHPLCKLNAFLRKHHKLLGIVSIFVTMMHCGISEKAAGHSSALGAFLFLLLILLALSYCFRDLLKKKWLFVHHLLTGILVGGIFIHILMEIVIL